MSKLISKSGDEGFEALRRQLMEFIQVCPKCQSRSDYFRVFPPPLSYSLTLSVLVQ
jgi:hypothetical protein